MTGEISVFLLLKSWVVARSMLLSSLLVPCLPGCRSLKASGLAAWDKISGSKPVAQNDAFLPKSAVKGSCFSSWATSKDLCQFSEPAPMGCQAKCFVKQPLCLAVPEDVLDFFLILLTYWFNFDFISNWTLPGRRRQFSALRQGSSEMRLGRMVHH